MTELIIKAFIFLAIAISVPFAAGLAFACAAFSAILAVSVRRTGNKRRKVKREADFISGFVSVKADIADCEDCDVAACSVRSPREVPPLYDDETAEDREEKSDSLKAIFNDVMRLIGKTEDEARLNAVKRAIAGAGKRSAALTEKKRDYPV